MIGSIDTRVVQLEFDNRDFERNVQTSLKTIDKLNDSLQFDGVEKGATKLSNALGGNNGVAGAISQVQMKFSALEIAGKRIIERLVDSAISGAARITKSLTTDLIGTGFSKKSEKDKSEATILAAIKSKYSSEEEALEHVTDSVEKLAWFTDETSYNMTDMISNIGKFTSAGADIDGATKAMMGMATATALAGQGASEATRVMYNMSQAYGSGAVKLMDWKSVENANVATESLKNTMIETAVAAGTLYKKERKVRDERGKYKKDENGKYITETYYSTDKKGKKEVNAANFNTTLAQGWLTKDVMEQAFGKYAEFADAMYAAMDTVDSTATDMLQTIEAGTAKTATREDVKKAQELLDTLNKAAGLSGDNALTLDNINDNIGLISFKAAQEARTFQDAKDAIKDVMSSGWMEVFDAMFGDFKESTKLWTTFANEVSGFFYEIPGSIAETIRLANSFTLPVGEDLKQMTAAEAAISGISDAWESFKTVVETVKQAYTDVFGEGNAIRLARATKSFAEFMESIKPSEEFLEKLRNALGGVFSVFDIGLGIVKHFVKLAFGSFRRTFGIVLNVASGLGKLVKNTHESLKANKAYEKVQKKLEDRFASIRELFTGLSDKFKNTKIFESLSKKWDDFNKKMAEVTSFGEMFKFTGEFIKGVFEDLTASIRKFIEEHPKLKSVFDTFKNFFSTIGDFFSSWKKIIKGFVDADDKGKYLEQTLDSIFGPKGHLGKSHPKLSAIYSIIKGFAKAENKGEYFEATMDSIFGLGGHLAQKHPKITAIYEIIKGFAKAEDKGKYFQDTMDSIFGIGGHLAQKHPNISAVYSIIKGFAKAEDKGKYFRDTMDSIFGPQGNLGKKHQKLAAIYSIIKGFGDAENKGQYLRDTVKSIFTHFLEQNPKIHDFVKKIVETVVNIKKKLHDIYTKTLGKLIAKVRLWTKGFIDADDKLEYLKNTWTKVKASFTKGVDKVKSKFKEWADSFKKGGLSGLFKKLGEDFSTLKSKVIGWFKDIFGTSDDETEEGSQSLRDKLKAKIEEIKTSISNWLMSAKERVKGWFSGLWAAITGKDEDGEKDTKTLSERLASFFDMENLKAKFDEVKSKVSAWVNNLLYGEDAGKTDEDTGMINDISVKIDALKERIIISISKAWEEVKTFVSNLWKDLFSPEEEDMDAGADEEGSGFSKWSDSVIEKLDAGAKTISDWFKNSKNKIFGEKEEQAVTETSTTIGEKLNSIKENLSKTLGNLKGNLIKWAAIIGVVYLLFVAIKTTAGILNRKTDEIKTDKLKAQSDKFKAFGNMMLKVAGSVTLILLAIYAINKLGITLKQFLKGMGLITVIIVSIAALSILTNYLNERFAGGSSLDSFGTTCLGIAASLLILAAAIVVFTKIFTGIGKKSPGALALAIVVVGLLAVVMGIALGFAGKGNSADSKPFAMLLMCLSLAILLRRVTKSVVELSSIDPSVMWKSAAVIAALTAGLGLMIKWCLNMSESVDSFKAFLRLAVVVASIYVLAEVLQKIALSLVAISSISPEQIEKGGTALAILMVAIGLVMSESIKMSSNIQDIKDFLKLATVVGGIYILALACGKVAEAMSMLSSMNPGQIVASGLVIAGVLGILGVVVTLLPKLIKNPVDIALGAALCGEMLLLAEAANILAPALASLSGCNVAGLIASGLVLSAIFVAMGFAMNAAGKNIEAGVSTEGVSVYGAYKSSAEEFKGLADAAAILAPSLIALAGYESASIAIAGGVIAAVLAAMAAALLIEGKDVLVGAESDTMSAYASLASSGTAFLDLANAAAILAPSLIALAEHDSESIAVAGGVIAAVLAAMAAALLIEGKDVLVGGESDSVSAYASLASSGTAFLDLAHAVAILAPSLIALSSHDKTAIATAGGVISAVLLAMGAALMLEGKDLSASFSADDITATVTFSSNSQAFVDLANACSTIAGSLVSLASESVEDIAAAGGVLSAILLAVSGAILASKDINIGEDGGILSINTNSEAISSALTAVSGLVEPLKSLSGVSKEELSNAKTAITDILSALSSLFSESGDVKVLWGLFSSETDVSSVVTAIKDLGSSLSNDLVPILPELQEVNGESIRTNMEAIGAGLKSIMDAATKNANKITGLANVASMLSSLSTNVDTSSLSSISNFMQTITGDETSNEALGSNFMEGIINGIKSKVTSLKSSVSNACSQMSSAARGYRSVMYADGIHVMEGFVNGISSQKKAVADMMREVCKEAAVIAEISLQIHSPSRVFAKIGEYLDLGFAKGIKDNASEVSDSVSSMCDSAIGLASMLTADFEDQLTITPVVDLSNVEDSSKRISNLLGYGKALGVSSTLRASQISSDKNRLAENQNGAGNTAAGATYTFTQNNYSPKALSRADIYRQTKNQFTAMKGLVGNV